MQLQIKNIRRQSQAVVHRVKLMLLGGVSGKTNILVRMQQNRHEQCPPVTIGVDQKIKSFPLSNKSILRLFFCDTGGQGYFLGPIRSCFQRIQAVLLIYDVTDYSTFQSIKNLWYPLLKEEQKDNIFKVLIGNKIDLQIRKVHRQTAELYAKQNNMMYFEISAKTGENFKEFQTKLTKQILRKIVYKDQKGYQQVKIIDKSQGLKKEKNPQLAGFLDKKPFHNFLQASRVILKNIFSSFSKNSSGNDLS